MHYSELSRDERALLNQISRNGHVRTAKTSDNNVAVSARRLRDAGLLREVASSNGVDCLYVCSGSGFVALSIAH